MLKLYSQSITCYPPENTFSFFDIITIIKSTRVDSIYTCAFCALKRLKERSEYTFLLKDSIFITKENVL